MGGDDRVTTLQARLAQAGYIAERSLSASLLLFTEMQRPLLLEGDAGVGKTEIAHVIARIFDCPLIRLQCYEGLDVNSAVYEWNYQHQLLAIKLLEQGKIDPDSAEQQIFSKKYLLELLSDFQVSVPELGTIAAVSRPYVVLTSNGTRELSDALRRRCLYHYVDYPDLAKELAILERRLPEIDQILARQIVKFVHALRGRELRKKPGVAETLDWAASLMRLSV